MTDHKFTDDVIKALECCTNCICNHAKTDTECPLVKMDFCKNYLMKQSLALINRQKAEIESLKKVLYELKMEAEMVYKQRDAQKNRADSIAKFARAETIKEFAWRLKNRLTPYPEAPFCEMVGSLDIDALVEEMTEKEV